jgi:hypothetical protein
MFAGSSLTAEFELTGTAFAKLAGPVDPQPKEITARLRSVTNQRNFNMNSCISVKRSDAGLKVASLEGNDGVQTGTGRLKTFNAAENSENQLLICDYRTLAVNVNTNFISVRGRTPNSPGRI